MSDSKPVLVSKTVRLPEHLVDFIELQEGADFTKKLVCFLEEVRTGEGERCRKLAEYMSRMQALEKRIDGYYSLIYETRNTSRKYEALLRQLQGELDRMKEP